MSKATDRTDSEIVDAFLVDQGRDDLSFVDLSIGDAKAIVREIKRLRFEIELQENAFGRLSVSGGLEELETLLKHGLPEEVEKKVRERIAVLREYLEETNGSESG